MYYDDKNDLKRLGSLEASAPTEFGVWLALDQIVGREDGAIPAKYRELIAIAVTQVTQCPYCIEIHTKAAKKAGATKEELSEAIFIAAALRAGAAVTHGTMAIGAFDAS